jgi:hypothetical protein
VGSERYWLGSLSVEMRDASGLMYTRNRYYNPQTRQFTQPDPIGPAGGLNVYIPQTPRVAPNREPSLGVRPPVASGAGRREPGGPWYHHRTCGDDSSAPSPSKHTMQRRRSHRTPAKKSAIFRYPPLGLLVMIPLLCTL